MHCGDLRTDVLKQEAQSSSMMCCLVAKRRKLQTSSKECFDCKVFQSHNMYSMFSELSTVVSLCVLCVWGCQERWGIKLGLWDGTCLTRFCWTVTPGLPRLGLMARVNQHVSAPSLTSVLFCVWLKRKNITSSTQTSTRLKPPKVSDRIIVLLYEYLKQTETSESDDTDSFSLTAKAGLRLESIKNINLVAPEFCFAFCNNYGCFN